VFSEMYINLFYCSWFSISDDILIALVNRKLYTADVF